MARRLRIQFEGAIYHVTVRGVDRRDVFLDANDYERFLKRLEEVAEDCGVRVHLFCLMTNHFHLVLETPQANVSAFMHRLVTAYTVYFNLRHKRVGHLVQGRFGATLVQGDEYLLRLSRYVHLNPVFVRKWSKETSEKRVTHLREYGWSSYPGYAGVEKPYPFVEEGPVLASMGGPTAERRKEYRAFVETGIAGTDEEFLDLLKSARWGIGEDEFLERVMDIHTDLVVKARRAEDVSFRHVGRWSKAEDVLRVVGKEFGVEPESLRKRRYDCVARATAMYLLGKRAGLNQRQIAPIVGVGTGAAVSEQVRRLKIRLVAERDLVRKVGRADVMLTDEGRGDS